MLPSSPKKILGEKMFLSGSIHSSLPGQSHIPYDLQQAMTKEGVPLQNIDALNFLSNRTDLFKVDKQYQYLLAIWPQVGKMFETAASFRTFTANMYWGCSYELFSLSANLISDPQTHNRAASFLEASRVSCIHSGTQLTPFEIDDLDKILRGMWEMNPHSASQIYLPQLSLTDSEKNLDHELSNLESTIGSVYDFTGNEKINAQILTLMRRSAKKMDACSHLPDLDNKHHRAVFMLSACWRVSAIAMRHIANQVLFPLDEFYDAVKKELSQGPSQSRLKELCKYLAEVKKLLMHYHDFPATEEVKAFALSLEKKHMQLESQSNQLQKQSQKAVHFTFLNLGASTKASSHPPLPGSSSKGKESHLIKPIPISLSPLSGPLTFNF